MIGSVDSLNSSLMAVSLNPDPIDETARALISLSYQQLYQEALPVTLQAAFTSHKSLMNDAYTCNQVLEQMQAYLNRTTGNSLDLLRQRIHVRHFLLRHVIKDRINLTSTDSIQVALNQDLAQLIKELITPYLSNKIPQGENQTQLQLIHTYHSLYRQQLPSILALFEKALFYPTQLSEQTRSFIYPRLWEDYVNFANCELAYSKVHYLHNDLDLANEYLKRGQERIALVQTHFQQMLALKCVLKKTGQSHKLALLEQSREIKAKLTKKVPVNPFQFSLNAMKKLTIFESQFQTELDAYQRNITRDPTNTDISETAIALQKQIEASIEGVQNASKETDIADYIVEIHFNEILEYLHQVDQIKNTAEAKILLPLMIKLLIQWQLFFKQPNILMKHNIETLKRITQHLVTVLQALNGKNPNPSTVAKIDNCLLLGPTIARKVDKKTGKKNKHSKASAKPQLSSDIPSSTDIMTATPTPLPALNQGEIPVAGINIPIPSATIEVLTLLHEQGYEAYIAGGYVRDCLLKVRPHDVDLITNCPREKILEILGKDWGANPFNNQWFHHQNSNMDLVCTSASLHQEATQRDLSINALFADRFGNVYDPLGVIDDINKSAVQMLGAPAVRFAEDPKRLLRAIRIPIHVGKQIPNELIDEIKQSLHTLTTLNFGAYLSEIHKVFGTGQGEKCGAFLIALQRFDALVATAPLPANSLHPHLGDSLVNYFLQAKLKLVDLAFEAHHTDNSAYQSLALLLLPSAIKLCAGMPRTLLDETLEGLLAKFSEQYPGYISPAEKNCLVKATQPFLQQFYTEYMKLVASTTIPEFVPQQQIPQKMAPAFPKPRSKENRSYTPNFQREKQKTSNGRPPRVSTLGDFLTSKNPSHLKKSHP